MGGGNAQKSATARARNQEKLAKSNKGSQLKSNAASMTTVCNICRQSFMVTQKLPALQEHASSKHPKNTFADCFPGHPGV